MVDLHILMKFISDEYVEAFLDGRLHFNTLYFYREESKRLAIEKYLANHPCETKVPVTALADLQAWTDVLEGTVGTGFDKHLDDAMGEYLLTDVMYRSVGFQYCNTLCFYKLRYRTVGSPVGMHRIEYEEPKMDGFGNSVIIIDDEKEFIRRIEAGIKNLEAQGQNLRFLCGDVVYCKPMKNGKASDITQRHHLMLQSDRIIDIEEEPYKGMLTSRRDCFIKGSNHSSEHEWRIALYRGVRDVCAYDGLQIGDIRDIAHCVKKDELIAEIDKMIKAGRGISNFNGYYGNIDRNEMRKLFYKLGDNKAEELLFI